MIKIDLSDVKVGDILFNSSKGWVIVRDINFNLHYPLSIFSTSLGNDRIGSFCMDGKQFNGDVYPSLFHSVLEMQEYFKHTSKEPQKKEMTNKEKLRQEIVSIMQPLYRSEIEDQTRIRAGAFIEILSTILDRANISLKEKEEKEIQLQKQQSEQLKYYIENFTICGRPPFWPEDVE
jgi:hypothetical protein